MKRTENRSKFLEFCHCTLDGTGTDEASRKHPGSMIGRYIIWRNNHAPDERQRAVANRANVA
ncbi:hypothetical protein AB0M57_14285 [Streptomyces sp. NPDC051597]|uniref:hypothetical protein n=1 Tax=Streptomyces sp. NPDC051597 TaxID=3155049 RepID=UPI003448535D